MAISDGFGISFGSKNISQGVPVTAVKSLSLSNPYRSVLPPLKCGELLIFSHQLFSHFKIDLNDAFSVYPSDATQWWGSRQNAHNASDARHCAALQKKEKISHTNFISRSKIPMGFRNTDEVKHKFKRACTTTELTERDGGERERQERVQRARDIWLSHCISTSNFIYLIYFIKTYTHFPA